MDRFMKLIYIGLIALALIVSGLWFYPFLDPLKPAMLMRSIVLRGTLFVFGVFGFLVALVLIDVVTPGDWLEKVGYDALSCSILLSAIVLGLSWMFCYA